ncbi:MAG: hypothetical protein Q8Q48_03035 [Candidatus Staskawiczbacteria bacterium]|nr:hypothetical protein [Candidatus Staskawiczbacteria bacterium]
MSQKDDLPIVLSKEAIAFAGGAVGLERFFKLELRKVQFGERIDDRIVWVRGAFILIVAITADRGVVLIREYSGTEKNCHVFGPFFNSPDKSTEIHFVVLVTDARKEGPPALDESETIMSVQLCSFFIF